MSDSAFTSAETAIGVVGVEATQDGIRRVRLPGDREPEAHGGGTAAAVAAEAAAQFCDYARGVRDSFDLPLDWSGVDATHRRVLETLCAAAPYGVTVTYGELGGLRASTTPATLE